LELELPNASNTGCGCSVGADDNALNTGCGCGVGVDENTSNAGCCGGADADEPIASNVGCCTEPKERNEPNASIEDCASTGAGTVGGRGICSKCIKCYGVILKGWVI